MADANRNGVVESAAALRELIRRNIDDIETRGELPAELVEAMSSGGLFRLFLPLDAGGPEATPREAFEVCENLARADGSAAWCASISSAISSYLAWLAPDVLTTIATPLDELRLSGSARPLGVATACRGGYRVTGRWDFASNISQATWYVGT